MRQQYQSEAQNTSSREAEAAVINQMLSQLKTSHTRLYIPEEPAYYELLGIFQPRLPEFQTQLEPFFPDGTITYSGIGIYTKTINDKTYIRAILEGSPAAEADLKIGDQLLSADGRPFHPIQSFADKASQTVQLVIQRAPSPDSQQTVVVRPKQFDAVTMFLEAQQDSIQVIEQQNREIGYVHVWSYANERGQQQLEDELLYGRLKDVDALILDLRGGWGGTPATVLNFYTGRGPNITSIVPRQGMQTTTYSNWRKPVVMVVNEDSRSAKEILAFGFQQYEIGTVVGSKTPGAVVAGRPFLMSDGSVLYVAIADVLIDGTRLEEVGVTPDVTVPFLLEYAAGNDPQKQRAIEIAVMNASKTNAPDEGRSNAPQ
jgi:carboxyl-terminal processing protease